MVKTAHLQEGCKDSIITFWSILQLFVPFTFLIIVHITIPLILLLLSILVIITLGSVIAS